MNDPNQGFNDDNHYRKLSGGGWAIDHPDGSTTIIARGEPLENPPREWLVRGVDGEWYDSNNFAEVEVEKTEDDDDTSSQPGPQLFPDTIPEKEEIIKVFHNQILEELNDEIKYCEDAQEVFIKSMRFVENKVPENIWSKHKDEISNEQSIVNRYLTEFSHNLQEGDETVTFKIFQAAVATYNTGQLLNVLDKEELLFKVFDQAVLQQNR